MSEQAVLSYIRSHIEANGYAPSVREIGKKFGWTSPATVQRKLQALVDDGSIRRVGPRAIALLRVPNE